MTNLIGLSGYAQSGKDTAALTLIELGYERRAFADKLKALALYLNPIVDAHVEGYGYCDLGCCGPEVELELLASKLGTEVDWDRAKRHDEVRSLLQRLGVGAREILGDSVWIDAALHGLPDSTKNVVVTDLRFRNEADAIRGIGGKVFRVERAGVGPVNGHVTETALDDYDFDAVIYNNGTIEDLHVMVRNLASVGVSV